MTIPYANCVATFIGRDFHVGDGLSLDGDRVRGTGNLNGEWVDGTRWVVNIEANSSTILAVTPAPGDADLDRDVDDNDLSVLLANWSRLPGEGMRWRQGDFDDDGRVPSLFGNPGYPHMTHWGPRSSFTWLVILLGRSKRSRSTFTRRSTGDDGRSGNLAVAFD